jgi:predicted SAM-dependent methyltransferase
MSTAAAARSRPGVLDAARRALVDHYTRIGGSSDVDMPRHEGIYRRRHSASRRATTTIVIAITSSDEDRRSELLESGKRLLATAGSNASLAFVAAGQQAAGECRLALAAADGSASVIAGSPEASRAALFDLAASRAVSDQLVFVSKPCEPLSSDWLEALASACADAGVGAVGARVQSPAGRVEDCGIVLSQGLPLHAEVGEDVTNWRRTSGVGLVAPRNWSAASGVVMVRRDVLRRAGGFETGGFDQLADVDLCLRLRRLGLRNVVTPFADLRRLGADDGDPPAVDVGELARFQRRWWSSDVDPYYHPALPADRAEFLPRPERRSPLPRWRPPVTVDATASPPATDRETVRGSLAWRYLRGSGLEIGALHKPLEVPPHARPRYVDRLPATLLRELYPELGDEWLIEPDILDDAERLEHVGDDSQDFVIANHLLEHLDDPIGAIETWLRVLRHGGTLYMAVPDKRFTFDADRSITTLDHLIRDHVEGAAGSRREHLEEWARFVERVPEPEVAAKATALAESEYSIHNHVWTQSTLIELLLYCREQIGPFEIEALQRNDNEVIVVLTKAARVNGGSADPAGS